METTTALAWIQKSVGTLKAVPIWLLCTAFGVSLAAWLWPAAFAVVPDALRPAVPAILWATGLSLASKVVSQCIGYAMERRQRNRARDREKLIHLYRPLALLFLTRHVTTSRGIGAPYLKDRIENALSEFGAYQRRKVGIKRALHALFDKRISSSGEMEFGHDFLLSQIIKLANDQAEYVDTRLVDLIAWADRSRYEDPQSGLLSEAELGLFRHIDQEHRRLDKRSN